MRVRFAPTPCSSPESESGASTSCGSSCNSTFCNHPRVVRRQRSRNSVPVVLPSCMKSTMQSLPRAMSERLSRSSEKSKARKWRTVTVPLLKDMCLDVLMHNVIIIYCLFIACFYYRSESLLLKIFVVTARIKRLILVVLNTKFAVHTILNKLRLE